MPRLRRDEQTVSWELAALQSMMEVNIKGPRTLDAKRLQNTINKQCA